MDYIVALRSQFGVIVYATVEDDITWLHLLFLESDWESVELIGLVPTVKIEAEIFSHIITNLTKKRTAIKEHRCIIERLTRVEVPLGIGNSKILLGGLKELFP